MRQFADEDVLSLIENPDPLTVGNLQVHFHHFPVKNTRRSAEEGRPVYENQEYVRIFVPKDKDTVIDRAVDDNDRRRFAAKYQAWKALQERPVEGTPLVHWAALDAASMAELNEMKIRTVEQLAGLSDADSERLRLSAMRQRAKDFLAALAGQAPLEQMRKQIEERDTQLSALRQQVKDLGEQLSLLQKRKAG